MISWEEPSEDLGSDGTLRAWIENDLCQLGRSSGDGFWVDDILSALRAVYSEESGGVYRMSDPALSLQIGRVLWSLGESDLARRYLLQPRLKGLGQRMLPLIHSGIALTPALVEGFLCGVYRHCSLESFPSQNSWMLDVRRLVYPVAADELELVEVRLLTTLWDGLCPVYDSSGGAGVLWVSRSGKGALSAWSDRELIEWINRRISIRTNSKRWSEVPAILISTAK